MQQGYRYCLAAEPGENFDPKFSPQLNPGEMLRLGIFEGKYWTDGAAELPAEWLADAKLSSEQADKSLNFFGKKSRQPLSVWREKMWITPDDPDVRGWFQWYCRYWLGRRDPALDERQIRRWKNFARHRSQIVKNCAPGDLTCRPRQRQALLQWAYDPRI